MTFGPISSSSPEEQLATWRAYTIVKAPYVQAILFGFVIVFVEGYGRIGITKNLVCVADPEWIMQFDEEEGGFIMMHEIGHVMRDTFGRLENRDPEMFNKAADIPDNQDLITSGWKAPKGPNAPLLPKTFDFPVGLSAEEYYELLKQKGGTKAKEKGHICGGMCGGIAGNPQGELEDKLDAEFGRGAIEKKAIIQQAIGDLKTYVEQGRGTVPGGLRSLLQISKKKSKIPWRRKFSTLLRKVGGRVQTGGADFSMARLSKSTYSRGIPRPGLIQQEPEIAFVEDTSGSMGKKQLQTARREASAVLRALGIDQAWWLDADAAVAAKPRRISVRDLATLPVHGGGGTDFRPALEACLKLRPKPDIIIYLTDGDGTAPEVPPPGVVVIWCIVPSYYNKRPASWGHAVIMRDEGDETEYPNLADDEEGDVDG
jgi:predicted metal-dependent peptidase